MCGHVLSYRTSSKPDPDPGFLIQGCGSGSGLDPDSSGSVDPDPDSGVGWPFLRAEGFFCTLDVPYGGLGIGKL